MTSPADEQTVKDQTGVFARTATLPQDSGTALASSEPSPVSPGDCPLDGSLGDRYDARRLLGSGGMGEVRLCKDTRIGREVAMKVIRPSQGDGREARARFLREAQVQGQLEHPSIVPVYDMGLNADGSVFFTMKRLRGMTLADLLAALREGRPDMVHAYTRRKLLAAFTVVCLAVDFAHARGVLHRDLKPANIMLGDFGEVYVLDWGIAKIRGVADDEVGIAIKPAASVAETPVDRMMGTVGYVSPEQACGMHDALDARSDVFSLGAILFEILTLERLRPKGDFEAMFMGILDGVDARASARAPDRDVPPELEAACVRATLQRPEDRFGSARELHDAVERFLDGDRDIELRRRMAEEHARAAEEAAGRALAGGDDAESARRLSLREVGRALALEPTNAAAMSALGRVITEPPREAPREVAAVMEAEAETRERIRRRLVIRGDAMLALVFFPALFSMGIRSSALWAALLVFLAARLASKIAIARMRRVSRAAYYGQFIIGLCGFAFTSRIFGPLFFMPVGLALYVFSTSLVPDRVFRVITVAVSCLFLTGIVALELTGVLPASYVFHDGALTILPQMVSLDKGPTVALLCGMSVLLIVTPAMALWNLHRKITTDERRILLQAWHLRQLLPEHAAPGSIHGAETSRAS